MNAEQTLIFRSRASCGCGWKITFGQNVDPSNVLMSLLDHAESRGHSCEMFASITKEQDVVNPLQQAEVL